jgi:hypothetical protein
MQVQQVRRYDLTRIAGTLTAVLGVHALTTLIGFTAPELKLQLLAFLVTVPVFLTWLHRARCNAEGLGHKHRWSTGWAIGAWFVPLFALVVPVKIVYDTWRAQIPRERHRSAAATVTAWWVCWLLAWFTNVRRVETVSVDPQGGVSHAVYFRITTTPTLLSMIFTIAAAVLLIVIVQGVPKTAPAVLSK